MRRDVVLGAIAVALVAAATLSMGRVFIDPSWRGSVWVAALLAVAVAGAARRLGLGAVAAGLASLVVLIVSTYVVHLEAGGLLPGREQLRQFLDLAGQGLTDLLYEPAPARVTDGLLLLASVATWVTTHVVHELLVRLRRPGPAILGAALLWAFPLAVPQPPGRTWPHAVPFLAAAGLALLAEPDPDLASWRRPATGRAPLSTGLVVGGVVLLVATIAPGVLPGYGAEPWVDLSAADSARGYQPIVDVSRRLKLPAPRDLLRVAADRPLYLRLAGLDTFDGATWRLGPADRSSFSPDNVLPADRTLPPEVEIGSGERVELTVENLSLENVFVPVPYHPSEIEGSAARRMVYSPEGTFIASSDTLEGEPALVPGLSYGVEAIVPTPSVADLQTIPLDAYSDPAYQGWTQLPQDYAELRAIAGEVVSQAGATTPFEVAFALQDFFRNPDTFRYSTDVEPLRDAGALTAFVASDRTGYCEYFATAMAVMLRGQGIPTRVAVGFRLGDEVQPGEYLVTTGDAHAWVEVLFPGHGWIQFEPTPALPDALVPTREDVHPDLPVGQAPSPLDPNPQVPGEGDIPEPSGERTEAPVAPPVGGGATDHGGAPAWLIALASVLVLALGAGTLSLRYRTRRRPDLDDEDRVLRIQHRVLRSARRYGVGRREAETARELARRWTREGRVEPVSAQRLAELAQAAAFGGLLEQGAGAEAEDLGRRVVADLRDSVPRSTRVTAPVRLPAERAVATGRRLVDAVRDRS